MVTKVVSDPNATGTSLDQLSGPEVYRVAVRAVCGGNSTYGPATPFNEFAIAQGVCVCVYVSVCKCVSKHVC